jgi:hypothetical protein
LAWCYSCLADQRLGDLQARRKRTLIVGHQPAFATGGPESLSAAHVD